jgi:hypothetical protein
MRNVMMLLLVIVLIMFSMGIASAGNNQTLGQGDPKCPPQTTKSTMLGQGDPLAPKQTQASILLGQNDPGVPKNIPIPSMPVPTGSNALLGQNPMTMVIGSMVHPMAQPFGQILIQQQ